jgi:methionine sulfoxide reductase heme-binding subunit
VSPTVWYVARSAGIVAYLLLSSSVVLGVLMAARLSLTWPRFAVEELHRFLAILTACFLILHGLSLLADRVVPLAVWQLAVPFTSQYRPFAVGLGVVAVELMAAVGVSNALRKRLPHRRWRAVHYLTIGVWALATVHAVLAGTDRSDPWFAGLMAGAVSAVLLAFAIRLRGPATALLRA